MAFFRERNIREVEGVVLIRSDGLVISKTDNITQADAERIGGVSSALLGMSNRVNGFLKHGKAKEIVVKGEDGLLYMREIIPQKGIMITVQAETEAPLGYLFVSIDDAAEVLEKLLK